MSIRFLELDVTYICFSIKHHSAGDLGCEQYLVHTNSCLKTNTLQSLPLLHLTVI